MGKAKQQPQPSQPKRQCGLLPATMNADDLQLTVNKLLAAYLGATDLKILMMNRGEGLSVRTIAENLDVCPTTVHRKLTKARTKLAKIGLLPKSWRTKPDL